MYNNASLELEHLTCIRNYRTLFEDLSLSVKSGQMLLVSGANGSGKTSLLRLITGLSLADNGTVKWNGDCITKLAGEFYQHVCYIGHHDGVKHQLTCLENLRLARAMGISSELDLDQVLSKVNLYEYGQTEAGSLSAGQRRRLALARLFATDSQLWILDEPFTSLDTASMAMFESLFEQHLANQGLIVITSHHAISLPENSVARLELS